MDPLNQVLAFEAVEHSALLVPRDAPRNDPVPKIRLARRSSSSLRCSSSKVPDAQPFSKLDFLNRDMAKRLVKTTTVNSHLVTD